MPSSLTVQQIFLAYDMSYIMRLSIVKLHVENGVNLNYQHPEVLETLLVTAIKSHHTEVALYLLENGADPNLESYFDQL